jgi:hypothetical protein
MLGCLRECLSGFLHFREGVGILRRRSCFAVRTSYFAQDDTGGFLYVSVRCEANLPNGPAERLNLQIPRLRSGFRQRAPTPAERLNFAQDDNGVSSN